MGAGSSQSVLEMAELIQLRCAQVLGLDLDLKYRQNIEGDKPLKLNYRTNHLNSLGINIKSLENKAEIDGLLQFCQTAFT